MEQQQRGRVLLVDDDANVRTGYARGLTRDGWAVETARDGLEAKERVTNGTFDVIVSDIQMPGYGGIQFLRTVRELGLDVPVVLLTGNPTIDSTIRAIEHGVFRYLLKPVTLATLQDVVARAAALFKMAALKREAEAIAAAEGKHVEDRAALNGLFQSAIDHLWVAFQPIVSWKSQRVHGYEALLRSDEPAMASPSAFLDAAERLGRLNEIGRSVRTNVAHCGAHAPEDAKLFVNLHAQDLNDETLFDPTAPLARIARRVVLEITERSSLDGVNDVGGCIKKLKALGFQIAIDDLGAGYAGLTSFTQLDPDVAKLDMSLIRNIDTHAQKQTIVRAMKALCDDLGIVVVAEGVETIAERDTLVSLGCDLLQGYLFARPARGFARPTL